MPLTLTSPAFAANGEIPARHTCEGEDASPPLAWSGAPQGTQSFALIVDDPDAPDPKAPRMTWVHWVLYNLPAAAGPFPPAPGKVSTTGSRPATAAPARPSAGIAISTSFMPSTRSSPTSGLRPRRSWNGRSRDTCSRTPN